MDILTTVDRIQQQSCIVATAIEGGDIPREEASQLADELEKLLQMEELAFPFLQKYIKRRYDPIKSKKAVHFCRVELLSCIKSACRALRQMDLTHSLSISYNLKDAATDFKIEYRKPQFTTRLGEKPLHLEVVK